MELFRALAALAEPPSASTAHLADALALGGLPTGAEHTELFVFQLNPCASIYLGADGRLGGEARDRIAGFWRAIGETPPTEPDHLTVMLALYARLADFEDLETLESRRSALQMARKAFLWEHLASWLPPYLQKVQEVGAPAYRSWAGLALEALVEEVDRVGPPEILSLHLREAPALEDPRIAEAEGFLPSLLVPVRSGMILTRHDLSDASRALGLGLRMGERRFALQSLVDQDARSTLTWLADHAALCHSHHARHVAVFGETAGFWSERAAQTGRLLRTLAADIGHTEGRNIQ